MRGITVFLLLALALISGTVSAQSYSTLEERMTGAEFKTAGLHKLSNEELAALNAWLQKQSGRVLSADAGAPAATPAQDSNGFDKTGRHTINSRLVGEFTGWTGNARFVLENGQEWIQVDSERLSGIKPVSNPAITIKPGIYAGWRLRVEGYNSTVQVKRVK